LNLSDEELGFIGPSFQSFAHPNGIRVLDRGDYLQRIGKLKDKRAPPRCSCGKITCPKNLLSGSSDLFLNPQIKEQPDR
jgi:hypothetical protein